MDDAGDAAGGAAGAGDECHSARHSRDHHGGGGQPVPVDRAAARRGRRPDGHPWPCAVQRPAAFGGALQRSSGGHNGKSDGGGCGWPR